MNLRCKTTLLLVISIFGLFRTSTAADPGRICGQIVDARTGKAVCGAVVGIEDSYLWSVSDDRGEFFLELRNAPESGNCTLLASCLGYVPQSILLPASGRTEPIVIRLKESSLAIDEVIVTARQQPKEPGTAFVIERNALDHLQMSSVSNIAALLPGGKTVNPDLTVDTPISLREGGDDAGNAAFGTAIEVDGVRMGNNASFGAMDGVGTRSIAVANIESVEIIAGVPSAEYGDMNSGIVRIRTRRGHTPWNLLFTANPRTYQVSAAKGIDLERGRGVLNVSAEWARATRKLTSPYTSYSRRGLSLAYSNTFLRKLRFEAGLTGNIGGMNTEEDPDAYTGAWIRERDNVFQGNASLTWLLNKPWVTNLRFDLSANLHDTRTHDHAYNSSSSQQPAVHATTEGYYLADKLPYTYFSDRIVDSKELDMAASLKYEWNLRGKGVVSNLKAGVQWKATGNAGRGEYYDDPTLAPSGYRPRPYSDYPYMHNIALYAEENLTLRVGATSLRLTAGLRMENLLIRGSKYDRTNTFSPRLNARWQFTDMFAVRGGWGITEKLPSYYILYPEQKYLDVLTFGVSYNNNESSYLYYTKPYTLLHNPALRWQRNHNAELGFEAEFLGTRLSAVAFYNRTRHPYKYSNSYTPASYNLLTLPEGYTMPAAPQFSVDHRTGMLYVRANDGEYWTPMEVSSTYRTFVESTLQDNGADIERAGVELVADFPEIRPLRTRLRLDASYNYTSYVDDGLTCSYQSGQSYTPYVGIYATGGSSSTANGRRTHALDANLTAITHIPQARLVITCRLEMALVRRTQNLSRYQGGEYAFNVGSDSNDPAGGSIYDSNSFTAIRPVAYIDADGVTHPFTDAQAADGRYAGLIRKSNNAYTFTPDGYDAYFSANLSITKEIGDHVSLSFFANNFTRTRRYVTSFATGVSAIFTPQFYYGLTCRLKF